MIPVKVYDNPDTASNNPVADLKNANNVSYEKRINRAGKASFTLPADDPHVDDIDLLDYAEVFDGDERVGLYRIKRKRPTKSNNTQEIQYECRHVLDTLNQGRIVDKITQTGVSTALNYILNQQHTSHWSLGTVDFSKSFAYEFQQQSLLNALLSVPQVWWDDYEFTYDTASYPWTLNLIKPDTTPQAALYYDKNIKTIEKEISTDELVTELYALGDGSGDDRVKVGPLTNNTGTYGYHTKIWEESHYDNATDLETAAQKYLNKHDTPRISYSGDADDFYRIMEDSNNQLELGDYVRVYDPDLDFDVSVRIVKLKKNNVTGEPASLSFELNNQQRLVPNFGALAREDKVTEDNINSGSVGGGSIASGGVGSANIADQAVTFSKFNTEFLNEEGDRIEGNRMQVNAQTVFTTDYDPQTQWPDDAVSPDSAKVQGETLIEGGYIKTVYLEAEFAKIDELDLTDTTLTLNSVKEGNADETAAHVSLGDAVQDVSTTGYSHTTLNGASLDESDDPFVDDVSLSTSTFPYVYSVSTTTDTINGTTVVTSVSTSTGNVVESASISYTTSDALVDSTSINEFTNTSLYDVGETKRNYLQEVI